MDPRAWRYSSYGYPNASWGYSSYDSPHYGYPTTPPNYQPKALETSQAGKNNYENSKKAKNKSLIATVVILALLLMAVIIALIVVGKLYQQKDRSPVTTTDGSATESTTLTTSTPSTASTTTSATSTLSTASTTTSATSTPSTASTTSTTTTTSKPSTTIFGLNITRTDLQYVADLADPNSQIFSNTSFQFCDMVMREWLGGNYPTDTCKCVNFWQGSVICEGHVEVDTSTTSATDILAQVGVPLMVKSSYDPRTLTVQASDIIIVK